MGSYTASTPGDDQVKPDITKYFEKFYEVSDTPDAHEKYSEQYTKNAKLIMGPIEVNGRDGKCNRNTAQSPLRSGAKERKGSKAND